VLGETGAFEGGSARVLLEATCASVEVSTTPGAAWGVEVRGTDGSRPSVERSTDRLVVRAPNTPVAFPFSTRRSTWGVQLGRDPQLDLQLNLNAGSAIVDLTGANLSRLAVDGNAIGSSRLDLSGATVGTLDASVNAADIAILLPAAGGLQGTVQGNAASVDLCAPSGVGLRLVVDKNITASNNFAQRGLVERDSAWESSDYATATSRTELRVSGAAVSFTLNPEDGCR
jgi:hypothetical protein